MKRKNVYCALALAAVLPLASCGWFSSSKPPISADKIAEARKYIQYRVVHSANIDPPVTFRVFATGNSYIKSVTFTPRKMKIVTETRIASLGNTFVMPIKYLSPGSGCDDVTCLADIYQQGDTGIGSYFVGYEFHVPRNDAKKSPEIVYSLSYALEVLREAASQPRSETPEFEQAAHDYRHASSKPELPEQARQLKASAELEFKDKKFDGAADDYAEALEIAPWWPEGHHELALALAELKDPYGAIDEMKCYLALVPDAADAQAAEDKIKDWEKQLPRRR
jgi:tetratricopeptide (TPR) repeat protein